MMNSNVAEGYDVIGDIHGHGDELLALLRKLGYYHDGISYRHDSRQAFFLGDFIDRGPKQRLVLQTVMAMCRSGTALTIMGNHEFNALAYHTEHPKHSGNWLRSHSEKNTGHHRAFLKEYSDSPTELRSVLDWFMEIPLWLELPEGLRLVHACWDSEVMERLKSSLASGNTLTPALLIEASESGTDLYKDVETVLKGKEITLPADIVFTDKDGTQRHEVRIRWWESTATFYSDLAQPPYIAERNPQLKQAVLPAGLNTGYGETEVPILFGHYWFEGTPKPEKANVACLDYSVPRQSGKLVAYRWSGEAVLSPSKFVSVGNMTGPY